MTDDAIVQRARDLAMKLRRAVVVAEAPDLVYVDVDPPSDEVLYGAVNAAEAAYYEHLAEHRDHLSASEFGTGYEFLDWLASENADIRDYQTWTNDPEQPLRRADRRVWEEQPETPQPGLTDWSPWPTLHDDPPF